MYLEIVATLSILKKFQKEYVLVPADKACNNIIIIKFVRSTIWSKELKQDDSIGNTEYVNDP